jgi:RNA polymerase sigma-70 factor (ECF subfamily)
MSATANETEDTSAQTTERPPMAPEPCVAIGGERARRSPDALRDLNDQQLLEGLRCDSEPHFSELYQRYYERIYRFVYTRVRNHADAEEIVQETFVSVFRSIGNFRGQSSLLGWVYGIAKNTANSALRRSCSRATKLAGATTARFEPAASFESHSPEELLSMRRYGEALREEFGAMAAWRRRVFEMRHLQNLSIPEIAKRTQRSNDAVRSSLYRVKRMMLAAAEAGQEQSPE